MRRLADHEGRATVRLAFAFMSLLVATAALSGCASSTTADESTRATSESATRVVDAENDIRLAGPIVDFREWATKKSSLAEAEESLGIRVRPPVDTRGRKLAQIYVLEMYPDGQPVGPFDQVAILDYGDFYVAFEALGSTDTAQVVVNQRVDDLAVVVGLGSRTQVRGSQASVTKKGEVPMKVDAAGKVIRSGVSFGSNSVAWSHGSVLLKVNSTSVSSDELLEVARSVDYD